MYAISFDAGTSKFIMFNEPTSHLDLESIQALNNAMKDYKGTMLFSSHDHTITQSVANRIVEINPENIMIN